ncbi:sugar phosphate isomerase/epimerase family protein [Rosenbergiella australiborealis]|uniref:sugar phosphate isomerase/epimerase family protein n=1 Tax=Rosenbergiella australiborealis TaxID=1544696 RepID=UPI001F4E4B7C|nr:sugar phosphate isomerase/epimerase [Rosenbergiella australiborealis]
MMERKIIVVTAAFGAEIVRQAGGQEFFIPLIAQAGADGVEIRRELLPSINETLINLAELAEKNNLFTYYSVPEYLFIAPGILNPQLAQFIQEATLLNAQAIKFALGAGAGALTKEQLSQQLSHFTIPLLIENDQTLTGKLSPMLTYFEKYHGLSGAQGMTFDMANWLWVDESPIAAAEQLAEYVSYCHVKAATQSASGWRAISLDDSNGEWRQLLRMMPKEIPLGIEFPLEGPDLAAVVHYYVELLRHA